MARAPLADAVEREFREAVGIAARARAASTRRTYEAAWARFERWCGERGLRPLPADGATVAVWLAALFSEGCKPSTVAVKAAAVSWVHGRSIGSDGRPFPDPCGTVEVRDVLAGVRNTAADRGIRTKQAAPILSRSVKAAVVAIDRATLRGRRDAAILLLGFSTALRRSELAALEIADVERDPRGLLVRIRRSKGDQAGKGQAVGVPKGADPATCPATALDAWLADLAAAGISGGPIFREVHRSGSIIDKAGTGEPVSLDPESLNRIVRRRLAEAGMDGASAHGLRAGFATECLKGGTSLAKVQAHLRHRDPKTTMLYYRDGDRLDGPPGEGLL